MMRPNLHFLQHFKIIHLSLFFMDRLYTKQLPYLPDIAYHIHTKLCLLVLFLALAHSLLSLVHIISIELRPISPHFPNLKLFDYSSPELCSGELYFLRAFAQVRCSTSTED